jgi:hypothetical protein
MSPPSSSGEHEAFRSFGVEPNFVESLKQKDAENSHALRNVRNERRQKRKKKKNRKASGFESLQRDGKKTNNASTERNGKVSPQILNSTWYFFLISELTSGFYCSSERATK